MDWGRRRRDGRSWHSIGRYDDAPSGSIRLIVLRDPRRPVIDPATYMVGAGPITTALPLSDRTFAGEAKIVARV